MSNTAVSVICIAYNHAKYIRETLEGFLKQKTGFKFEVLVHDDASTDGTADIIREYASAYPDVIRPVLQETNQYSKGKNVLFDFVFPLTQGKYVALCEGDDYWTDECKLQKQFDYMESHPQCSLVAHKSLEYSMKDDKFYDFCDYDFSIPANCDPTAEMIIADHLYFHTSSMFFKRDHYVRNAALYSQVRTFDYVTKTMLATEGDVHIIPEVMSVYRRGTEGSWTDRVAADAKALARHYETRIDNLQKINSYREYRFDADIRRSILKTKLDMELALGNKNVFRDPQFKDILDHMSKRRKLRLYLQLNFPATHRFIVKHIWPLIRGRKR